MSGQDDSDSDLNEEVGEAHERVEIAIRILFLVVNVVLDVQLTLVLVHNILLTQLQLDRVAAENSLCYDLAVSLPRVRNEVVHA